MADVRLVWVDLEMTGLDIKCEHIIEMAVIVTDGNLNVIAEAPNIVIHQPDDVLDRMGDWCKQHHGASGLTAAVQQSKISLGECEKTMLTFVEKHTQKGKSSLAGNSVHADKEFLKKYMPRFMQHLHYRIVDVSTIKVLCQAWYQTAAPPKKNSHRAIDDIRESIKELKFYKKTVFVKS